MFSREIPVLSPPDKKEAERLIGRIEATDDWDERRLLAAEFAAVARYPGGDAPYQPRDTKGE